MSDYQGYQEWKQWNKTSFGAWSEIDAAYFSAELRLSGIKPNVGIRIYEVGFGNGAFAGYMRSLGCDYLGSEINSTLIERARDFGLNVSEQGIKAILETQSGTVDAVVAYDVLEHLTVEDMKTFLLDSFQLLKQGGVVLARIPSGDSPFSRAIQHGDLTHRLVLGSSAVRQLALDAGFEVVSVRPPAFPLWGLSFLSFIRRALVASARYVIYPFIANVLMNGGKPVLSPNMVCVLRKQ
jgi:hypothetical protein